MAVKWNHHTAGCLGQDSGATEQDDKMQTVARKSLKLKACPKCGGDVCRMRDTFGVYHQCAQCGREIRRVVPSPTARMAGMPIPSNPTHDREKLAV